MIVLHFDGEFADKYFQIVYEGFMVGGSIERNKGLSILRKEMKILEKLETISEVFPCGKMLPINDEPCRKLIGTEQEVTFDKSELELISKYMGMVPWTTGKSVRNALEVIDWVDAALRDSGK